jgi:hypothetical protein
MMYGTNGVRQKIGMWRCNRKVCFRYHKMKMHYPFKDEVQTALFKDPVRTALKTLFISAIKTNQFML